MICLENLKNPCPQYEINRLYCEECYGEDVHDHKCYGIKKYAFDFFVKWITIYSKIKSLQARAAMKFETHSDLINFCESLVSGNASDSRSIRDQMQEITNVSNEIGQLFEDEIITNAAICSVLELENYNQFFDHYNRYCIEK